MCFCVSLKLAIVLLHSSIRAIGPTVGRSELSDRDIILLEVVICINEHHAHVQENLVGSGIQASFAIKMTFNRIENPVPAVRTDARQLHRLQQLEQ